MPIHSWRRADVQGLRGVAVLLVVLYHAGLHVRGGFTGVDLFFVISGFVITGLLIRELDATGSIGLAQFYRRRIRRLLPALAVLVVVVAAVGTFASPVDAQVIGAHTGLAASLFAANAYLYRLGTGYFDVQTTHDPLLHTWTLGVEEQFYLVFPVLLLIAWQVGRKHHRHSALIAVACVSVISFALAVALGEGGTGAHERLAFYGSPTRAWEFGVGSLIAIGAPKLATIARSALGFVVGVAGLIALSAAAFLLSGTRGFVGWQMLLPVLAASALIVAGFDPSARVTRLLSTRSLAWVGDRSYSWYLWHWPTIVYARALFPHASTSVAAALVSLAPAALSYRYVETPLRSGSGPRWLGTPALAAVCVLLPLVACVGLLGAHRLLFRTSALKQWETLGEPYLSSRLNCESTTPLGQRTGKQWSRCTTQVGHARGRIVLVGDSNAAQFSEPIVRAGTKAGYDVTLAPLTGCPFVSLRVYGTSAGEKNCYRFVTQSLDDLVRNPPTIVVAANRDDQMISLTRLAFAAPGGSISHDVAAKSALWEQGLATTLHRLNAAGIRVLLVRPVPLMTAAPTDCAVLRVLTQACASSVKRAEVAASLKPTIVAENQSMLHASRTRLLDLEDALCNTNTCTTVRNGTILYRDADHLSTAGARTLTTQFYRAFVARQ